MITFITAFVNQKGALTGCQSGDMPVPADFELSGATPVSLGYVIRRQDFIGSLSSVLLPLIRIAPDGAATLDAAANQYVTRVVAHKSTMRELADATTLDPLVAHWLSMRLHEDHDLKAKCDEEAAKTPHLVAVVNELAHQRFTPYELTPSQRLARNELRDKNNAARPASAQKGNAR